MNTKQIKAFLLSALFMGAITISGCNTGTDPGETNTERSDIEEEGSMDEGYTSEDYPADADTADMERYYKDAEGAVHAGDGKGGGVERDDVDKKKKKQ